MLARSRTRRPHRAPSLNLLALAVVGLFACNEPDDDDQTGEPTPPATESPAPESPTPPATPTPDATPSATATPQPGSPTPGPTDTPEATATPEPTPHSYSALIRRTGHGVVHILADDLGSVAFGQAYAFAESHVCTLADQVVKVRSERSRYFGAGAGDAHLTSDFGYLALGVYRYAQEGMDRLSPDVREMVRGYAAGYNQYVEDVGLSALPPECAGAAWMRPVTEVDLVAYYLSLALMSSGAAILDGIVAAAPPGDIRLESAAGGAGNTPVAHLPDVRRLEIGSNGWAIGGDRSAGGRGMVLANPHFPWEGELKLFESQLTVPGVLNVYGASLLGSPVPNIGFNDHLGWTHTVTSAAHFSVYRLELVPGDPTRYRYDNSVRQMAGTDYTIDVRQPDGSIQPVTRRLYRSHYGPMIATAEVGWSSSEAFSMRDANENNLALIEQFLRMGMAGGLDEFQQRLAEVGGIPWVHTLAADEEGTAFYADASAVPHLSSAALAGWQAALKVDPLTQYAWSLGLPLLDGSDSRYEWQDGGARPGIVPYDQAPKILRRDFVANANDNHWLTNPAVPLEGYSGLYGEERTPRDPRTRMNLVLLTEVQPDGASGADALFTLDELEQAMLTNRGMLAELLLDAMVERCTGVRQVKYEEVWIDIRDACAALSGWDGRAELDRVGAAVWRELIGSFEEADLYDAGLLFQVPFDPENPIETPHTLAEPPLVGGDPVLEALAAAVVYLEQAGIAEDTPLGEMQFTLKGEERIPLHGGQGYEGIANVIVYSSGLNTTLLPRMPRAEVVHSRTDLTRDGYLVNYGSSFMMALEFTDEGPRARGLLTYSQSDYVRSPYFADQTRLFSAETWRDVRFSEEEIAADPDLEVIEVAGTAR